MPTREEFLDILITKAWPKGRKLSAAHRAAISRALRKHHGGKGGGRSGGSSAISASAPAPSALAPAAPKTPEARREAKRLRAQKRREAAKTAQTTSEAPKTAKPDATTSTAKRAPKNAAQDVDSLPGADVIKGSSAQSLARGLQDNAAKGHATEVDKTSVLAKIRSDIDQHNNSINNYNTALSVTDIPKLRQVRDDLIKERDAMQVLHDHTAQIKVKPGAMVGDSLGQAKAQAQTTAEAKLEARREAKRARAQARREAAKNPPKIEAKITEVKQPEVQEAQSANFLRSGRKGRAQNQADAAAGTGSLAKPTRIQAWQPPKQQPGEFPADYIKRSRADKREWQRANPDYETTGKIKAPKKVRSSEPPQIQGLRSELNDLRSQAHRARGDEYRRLQDQIRAKNAEIEIARSKHAIASKSPRAIVREKVKFNNPRDSLDPRVDHELEMMAKIPPVMMQRLNNAGVKTFLSTDNLTQQDTNQAMANMHPRGWPPGSTWSQVGGAYLPHRRQVTTSVYGGGGSASNSTMLHELGHAAGHNFGYDTHPRVVAAHKQVFERLSPYLKQDGPGGAAGVQEFVAEAFATTLTNPTYARQKFGDDIVNFMLEEFDAHR